MSAWSPVPLGPVGYPLSSYTWGGCLLVYLTARDEVLCAACANDPESLRGPAVWVGAHESGEAIECDECGEEIASYYGSAEEDGERDLEGASE